MTRFRILVADGHDVFRQSVTSFLESLASVETLRSVRDGNEALAEAQALQPDIALVDVHLPAMSGYQAVGEIKRQCPHTKVVLLSIHPAEIYRRKAEESRADGYIDKQSVKTGLMKLFSECSPQFADGVTVAA